MNMGITVLAAVFAAVGSTDLSSQQSDVRPLEMARTLASVYPQTPSMSYIPALSWRGSFRLSELTGEDRWAEAAQAQMRPFIEGEREVLADPYRLTNLAALSAFSDLGEFLEDETASALATQAAELLFQPAADEVVPFATGWTDDMFMATSLLARVAARSSEPRFAQLVEQLLTTYAERLQREDGLFIHSVSGPFAWGRGNGFAALGLVEALTLLPETWSGRSQVLDIYRRHMAALLRHQSEDGSWRQVVDEPRSYRELTVTATTLTAMARGIRHGWLNRQDYLPAVEYAWEAIRSRVGEDGTVRDVCTSTGAGPTLEYYLDRPIVNGPDDRGGGLTLLAAVEMEELLRYLEDS